MPAKLGAVDKTENKQHDDDGQQGQEPHRVLLRMISEMPQTILAHVAVERGVGVLCGRPDVDGSVGQTKAAEHQHSHAERQNLHLPQWPRLEVPQNGQEIEDPQDPQEAAWPVGKTAKQAVAPATSPYVVSHRQRCWRYRRHRVLLGRTCWRLGVPSRGLGATPSHPSTSAQTHSNLVP